MTTLNSFTRSLEPITEFDDGGLSEFSALYSREVVEFRSSSRAGSYQDELLNIVLNGFLKLHCDQNPSLDARSRNELFQMISSELRKHVGMRPIYNESLQQQVTNGLSRLLQAGASSLSQHGLRPTSGQDLMQCVATRSLNPQSLVRFQQPLSFSRLTVQTPLNVVDYICLSSKLYDEFDDIKPLAEGRGAFGKVYTAKKKSDDVTYAVKKIKIGADDRNARGMHREVVSLSRMSHPNIVRYYDSWQGYEIEQQDSDVDSDEESESSHFSSKPAVKDNRPALRCYLFIHMELCETTLKQWLQQRLDSGVDFDKSYEIAKQILEGIAYIHSKEWFHRDLKPLNIFLVNDSPANSPNVKIGDFGLARQTSNSDSDERSHCRKEENFTAKVGTALYGAPEQLNGSVYSTESDMFSVGLIFYELYYLFQTDAEKHKLFGNLRKGKIDGEFESSRPVEALIIRQLTAKDPSKRPSAVEALQMLGSRRNRDIANADLACSFESVKSELAEMKKQLAAKDEEIRVLKALLAKQGSS